MQIYYQWSREKSKVGDKPIMGGHNREGSRISQPGAVEAEGWKGSKAWAARVGEGPPPAPPKLVERIEKGDLAEMCELIPEFWMVHKGKEDVVAQWPGARAGISPRTFMCGYSATQYT